MSEPRTDTSEQDHAHICPICMDSWRHSNDECCATGLDALLGRHATWAKCPMHEGRDE